MEVANTIELLIAAGIRASQSGDRRRAIELFEEASKLDAEAYRPMAMLGHELFATKRFDEAKECFERGLDINATGFSAIVGLGLIERRAGHLDQAIERFAEALECQPDGRWAANELVVTYVAARRWQQAKFALRTLENVLAPDRFRLLSAFVCHFAGELSEVEAILIKLASRLISSDSEVLNLLAEQIRHCRSGALIRLGDGEGCFVYGHRADAVPVVKEATHGFMCNAWFGEHLSVAQDRDIYADLKEAIGAASFIGVPLPSRLEFELRNDVRGAIGVAEAALFAKTAPAATRYVDANINLNLACEDWADRVIGSCRSLHTITPHFNLGSKLRERYGVAGEDFVIPGQHDSVALPASVRMGSHLSRYGACRQWIEKTVDAGSLVLVAGGLLGKCYAGAVAHRGAFALDVGAVADLWMGFRTRGIHYFKRNGTILKL